MKTKQEEFWAGLFGKSYAERPRDASFVSSSISLFSKIFSHMDRLNSAIEFGANIGLNLRAIRALVPSVELAAVEINGEAVKRMREIEDVEIFEMSILDFVVDRPRDFSFTKGVLIHIAPEDLSKVYQTLYQSSSRYIAIIEYYNPSPVEVQYHGQSGFLFKRDFAGEMLDRYSDLKLIDYGFVYRRDPLFSQDDLTWFLLEKRR